jgi:photosystem II stability/assembly factor-like uncharacterized protein
MILFLSQSVILGSQEWKACNLGLPALNIKTMAINNDLIIIGLANNGLFKSQDLCETWSAFPNNLIDKKINKLILNNSNIYVATNKFGMFYSSNLGDTWINIGLEDYDIYTILQDNNKLFSGGDGGIFRSNDNGNNWEDISEGLLSKDILKLNHIGDKVFAGSFATGFYTLNESETIWSQKNSGLEYLMIRDVSINDNDIYLATCDEKLTLKGSVYLSKDFGVTWECINSNMPYERTYCILSSDSSIYVGGVGKVFYSLDKGTNWFEISSGLPKAMISNLVRVDNYLFASLQNNGVYKLDISAVSVNDKNTNNNFEIFPNPANDFITISLGFINPTLQHGLGNDAQISIYNILGEKVMTESIHLMTGSHRMNISDLPKGMYFMKVGDNTARFVKM